MNRFPHTVTVYGSADSTRINGNWVKGGDLPQALLQGRYETQTNATMVGADGAVIKINGILYMPPTVPELKVGAQVVVMSGAEQKAKGVVRQFDRTRVNARVWL